MKTLLALITFIGFLSPSQESFEIYGRWKLEKIELNETTLKPLKRDYYLTITDELIVYNLEINGCQTPDFIITPTMINSKNGGCTKICCDGKDDLISNYISYNGQYIIEANQLIITTSNSKIYLSRETLEK